MLGVLLFFFFDGVNFNSLAFEWGASSFLFDGVDFNSLAFEWEDTRCACFIVAFVPWRCSNRQIY